VYALCGQNFPSSHTVTKTAQVDCCGGRVFRPCLASVTPPSSLVVTGSVPPSPTNPRTPVQTAIARLKVGCLLNVPCCLDFAKSSLETKI